MAADLGIIRIYASGKMVGTETNMNKTVFKLMTDSMTSDIYQNSLVFDRDQIKNFFWSYQKNSYSIGSSNVWGNERFALSMGCYPAYTEKLRCPWSDQTIQVHFFKDVSMLCYLPHFSSKRKRKGSLCKDCRSAMTSVIPQA
ncbi:hypothetical protein Patl1_07355 [Pistacia atlantica]|uniref:Uncharacterized protein n=1 Tax=Pistacia atlantica TaxID=434234 RepID=A0ACC1AHJ3_9ROSI|nr:hypothetical protein Patl1_07355 [Pistacia atlantica]